MAAPLPLLLAAQGATKPHMQLQWREGPCRLLQTGATLTHLAATVSWRVDPPAHLPLMVAATGATILCLLLQ